MHFWQGNFLKLLNLSDSAASYPFSRKDLTNANQVTRNGNKIMIIFIGDNSCLPVNNSKKHHAVDDCLLELKAF